MIDKAFFEQGRSDLECWIKVLQGNFGCTPGMACVWLGRANHPALVNSTDIPFQGEPAKEERQSDTVNS